MKINGIQNPLTRFVSPQNSQPSLKNGKIASYSNPVSFGSDDGLEGEKQKKSGISVKKLTNILGTVAGLGIIGTSAIYMARRPKWMKLESTAKTLETKIKAQKSRYQDALDIADGKQQKGGWLYRLGYKTNALVDKIGEELSNNLLYGIGTVFVMPLVILFSPFGKKNSSKEDKKYAVYRQPLSFATMFSIQLTNDKVFKRWSKAVVDQNFMETDKVQKALKNGDISGVLDDIKYNDSSLKKYFEEQCTKILGENNLQAEEKGILEKIKNADMKVEKLKEFLSDKSKRNVTQSDIDKLVKHFDRYAKAAGRNKLVTESLKIGSNVLVSQFIGCTLLNVIYGKVMKRSENKKHEKQVQAELVKKVNALYDSKVAEGSVA